MFTNLNGSKRHTHNFVDRTGERIASIAQLE
jgi:hypothetical protein